MKRTISMLLAVVFMVLPSMSMATYAAQTSTGEVYTEEWIINELTSYGFSTQEINQLLEDFYAGNEAAQALRNQSPGPGISLFTAPGDRKTETYTISKNWLASIGIAAGVISATDWKIALIKFVGIKILPAVAVIAAGLPSFLPGNGIKVSVVYQWTYGDNSMEYSWIPVSFSYETY